MKYYILLIKDNLYTLNKFLEQVIKPSKLADKAKEDVVNEPEPSYGNELSPYELYIKLLQYRFGDMLDIDTAQVISEYLPKDIKPLEYQLDAVKQCFSVMRTHGGFMLADVVGLGKTIVGTLVIKHFLNFPDDERERKVLIITPPAIKSAWVNTIKKFDKDSDNLIMPFVDFVTTGSIGNLVDSEEDDELDDMADFEDEFVETNNYGLIIIDESHKFRNSETQMYKALDNLISNIGANTGCYPYVGLLSATPQNNTPSDLKNQIYLFERNRQYCTLDKVDGRNLESFFSKITKTYNSLRKEANDIYSKEFRTIDDEKRLKEIDAELKGLSVQIRDCVLCDILVRRTRTDIEKYYSEDMKAQGLVFPKIKGPNSLVYKMDDELANLFYNTMNIIAPDNNYKFSSNEYLGYYRYRLTQFLVNDEHKKRYCGKGSLDVDKLADQLAKIMQILLVKRLESSFTAFTTTLVNLRKYTENMIKMWENDTIFICPQIDVNAELDTTKKDSTFEKCIDDIRKKIDKLNKEKRNLKGQNAEYRCSDFDPEYLVNLKADLEVIKRLCDDWNKNSEDPKLDVFKENLRSVLFNPETNTSQKLVIFSEALDTVSAIKRACENKNFKVLTVTAENRDKVENVIRENFDANYEGEQKDDYQIIVATEVLSEGINLHRANVILNYDTPWNSTKLMQRIGRVNRFGSVHPYVYVYNFMPSAEGDTQIQLVNKAHIKLQAFHTMFGEDSKIFTKDETVVQYDLNEIVNGEESAYEKYVYELKQYREENPERYEQICSEESDLQMSLSQPEGNSYFVVRTPKMKGLYVRVDSSGQGKIIHGLEMYSDFFCEKSEKRMDTLPSDWEKQKSIAIRTVGQHLVKMNSYRTNTTLAISAKGYIVKLHEKCKSQDCKNLLTDARKMIDKGNMDVIKIIASIGKELFSDQGVLFPLSEAEIENLIKKRLDNIVNEQSKISGKPDIYIGLAK